MLDRELILPHMIAKWARETPDRVAMKDVEGRSMTYGELDSELRRWAGALRNVGVRAGENVVTMVPNSFESYLVWLGVAWLRAVEVPTNNMYLGEMLRYLITNSGARHAVISHPRMSASELESGYHRARRDFYRWGSIARGALARETPGEALRHAAYQIGWKKLGPVWDTAIRVKRLADARPWLERVLGHGEARTGADASRLKTEPVAEATP